MPRCRNAVSEAANHQQARLRIDAGRHFGEELCSQFVRRRVERDDGEAVSCIERRVERDRPKSRQRGDAKTQPPRMVEIIFE